MFTLYKLPEVKIMTQLEKLIPKTCFKATAKKTKPFYWCGFSFAKVSSYQN